MPEAVTRENLRLGYTTGACAAAAAKAAVLALTGQQPVNSVSLILDDQAHEFKVARCEFDANAATCSIYKDAGDDPDVTDGAELVARVSKLAAPGVTVTGGPGVGRVTKPGLEIAVGEAAINPVPRAMIVDAVRAAATPDSGGLQVEISVPHGEKLARRTLNARLGIIGGISILGTSGRVIPYATEAFTASIDLGLKVAAAAGCREVVLTTGRRSEKYAQRELELSDEAYQQVGDYIGFTLDAATRHDFKRVYVWGMVGKLSKLADGVFETHVKDSRIDIMFMCRVAADVGVPDGALREAVTARHLLNIMSDEQQRLFADRLCGLAAARCRDRVNGVFEVTVILSDNQGVVLGRGDDA